MPCTAPGVVGYQTSTERSSSCRVVTPTLYGPGLTNLGCSKKGPETGSSGGLLSTHALLEQRQHEHQREERPSPSHLPIPRVAVAGP